MVLASVAMVTSRSVVLIPRHWCDCLRFSVYTFKCLFLKVKFCSGIEDGPETEEDFPGPQSVVRCPFFVLVAPHVFPQSIVVRVSVTTSLEAAGGQGASHAYSLMRVCTEPGT